jgi:hypothetical protein
MSDACFEVRGFENIIQVFHDYPEKGLRRPVVKAFRKAAVPVKKAMENELPMNLKALKAALKIKPGKGKSMTLSVGFFGRQGLAYVNRKGQRWDPYQLVYWHNYGTLANRDSSHEFKKARGRKTSSWRGGIRPGRFVEKAVERSISEAERIFERTVEDEIEKFLEKNALR